MPTYRTESLLARLGGGVLKGYMMKREEEMRQKQIDDERAFQLQRDKSNQDFQSGLQKSSQDFQTSNRDLERTQALEDQENAFLMSLAKTAAENGAFSPDLASAIGELFGDDSVKQLDLISKRVLAEKEAEAKLKAAKGSGGGKADEITRERAFNYAQDYLGKGLSQGMYQQAAQAYFAGGQAGIDSWKNSMGELEKAPLTEPEKLAAYADIIAKTAKTNPKLLTELEELGVNPDLYAQYVHEGDEPADARRHTIADHYISTMGFQADQPVSADRVNQMLSAARLHTIPAKGMVPVQSLMDDLIRYNIGANDKKGQQNFILELITKALMPEQPTTTGSNSAFPSLYKTIGSSTPSLQRQGGPSDIQAARRLAAQLQNGSGLAGAVRSRAQGANEP